MLKIQAFSFHVLSYSETLPFEYGDYSTLFFDNLLKSPKTCQNGRNHLKYNYDKK